MCGSHGTVNNYGKTEVPGIGYSRHNSCSVSNYSRRDAASSVMESYHRGGC